jgi:hypothetical protein
MPVIRIRVVPALERDAGADALAFEIDFPTQVEAREDRKSVV